MSNIKNIWFIGGNSGGHIYPLITISKKIAIDNKNIIAIFFVPKIPLISNIIEQKKEKLIYHQWYYPSPSKNIFKLIQYFLYSFYYIFRIAYKVIVNKPDCIYSTGGYFSIPFAIVSCLFRIPFHLYHLDVIPGKASQLINNIKLKEYYLYPETIQFIKNKEQSYLIDYPIRYSQKDIIPQKIAQSKLGIINKIVILILGGSQGSREINQWIQQIAKNLSNKNIFIIHQTGKLENNEMEIYYKDINLPHIIFEYRDDIALYYNSSDIIICRCGAGTLAEVAYFKKDSLLIPLQNVANNHQLKNAEIYIKKYNNAKIIKNMILLEKELEILNSKYVLYKK